MAILDDTGRERVYPECMSYVSGMYELCMPGVWIVYGYCMDTVCILRCKGMDKVWREYGKSMEKAWDVVCNLPPFRLGWCLHQPIRHGSIQSFSPWFVSSRTNSNVSMQSLTLLHRHVIDLLNSILMHQNFN